MESEFAIKSANLRFVNAKDNYYKQFIYYFQFLDQSHTTLKQSYLWHKNPIFRNDNMEYFIGIKSMKTNVKFIQNRNYICDIELFEGESLNPRIRSKCYYGRILSAEELID